MSSFAHRYLQFKHHFAACPRGAGLLHQSISEGISRRPGCLKEELRAPERATLSRTFMTHWDLLSLIHKLRSDNRFSSLPSRADLLQAGQAPACLRMQKMNLSMMNQSSCSLRYPQRTANGAIYIYAHIYVCVNIYIYIYMYVGVYREVTSSSEVLASQEVIAPKLQSPRKALPRHLAQPPRGSCAGWTGPRQHVVEASGCNRQKQLFEETSNRGVPFSPSLPKK